MLWACGTETTAADAGTCREEVSGHSWAALPWGEASIRGIWVGSSTGGTSYVRAARADGSVAGLNRPGRFSEVAVSDNPLVGLSGTEAGKLIALAADGRVYENQLDMSQVWEVATSPPFEVSVHALATLATGELWAIGADGIVAHFDGRSWTVETRGDKAPLRGAWVQDGDLWVVGAAGLSHRDREGGWHDVDLASGALHGIFGLPSGELWVVGEAGAWLGWNGNEWETIVTNTQSTLYAVWADPAEGVWAAGDQGVLLHWKPTEMRAIAEELPANAREASITALHGARVPRLSAIGTAPDYVLELWGGTSHGSVIVRQEVTSTVCP